MVKIITRKEREGANKDFLVAFDLYLLRYVIKNKWYETHDVLRDYLRSKGHTVEYEKDTLRYDGILMKKNG